MVEKEKLAHDLTLVYLTNRFGVEVGGILPANIDDSDGYIYTNHLPSTEEEKYRYFRTEKKGIFGTKVEEVAEVAGMKVDDIFCDMISEYYKAYNTFLMILNDIEIDENGNIDPRSKGVLWRCDGCEDCLNDQEGFDWHLPTWTCKKCGFVNDLSVENIK